MIIVKIYLTNDLKNLLAKPILRECHSDNKTTNDTDMIMSFLTIDNQ